MSWRDFCDVLPQNGYVIKRRQKLKPAARSTVRPAAGRGGGAAAGLAAVAEDSNDDMDTGAGSGDIEEIHVNLDKVPPTAQRLIFVVNVCESTPVLQLLSAARRLSILCPQIPGRVPSKTSRTRSSGSSTTAPGRPRMSSSRATSWTARSKTTD